MSISSILVVEDLPMIAMIHQQLLEQFGIPSEIAPDGKQAIERFQTQSFAGVLMDIGLPDMDGITVTETLRSLEAKARLETIQLAALAMPPTPIIGLSAHAGEAIKQQALQAGMNAILSKPLTRQCLQGLIRDHFPTAVAHDHG